MSMEDNVCLESCRRKSGQGSLSSPSPALGMERSSLLSEDRCAHSEVLWPEMEKWADQALSAPTGIAQTGSEAKKWIFQAQRGPRFSWPWLGLASKWDPLTRWPGRWLVPRRFLGGNFIVWKTQIEKSPWVGHSYSHKGEWRMIKEREEITPVHRIKSIKENGTY